MKTLFDKALQFSVAGYSIIPVGPDKRPLIRSWKQYQENPADDVQIEKWWEQFPHANIGIITGKVSGLTVIDLDTQGTSDTLTAMNKFPETFTVRTGNGGYHLYYKHHPGLTISASAYPQYPGLDIRSDGGFVVAPYSTTSYLKNGKQAGGEYTIINAIQPAPFPALLFPIKKERRALSTKIGTTTGSRNESITSFIGQLLHTAPEEEWETEVWNAVQIANNTFKPPLDQKELRSAFESIVKKETIRRESLILSPIQVEGEDDITIKIRKNGNGTPYKDMANVLAVLSQHPYYKHAIRYNDFRQEIEYNEKPFEEADLVKVQYFMQTEAQLHGISKEAVYAAILHYANINHYDEAKEWLSSLIWDGTPRLHNWIHQATGVEDDSYHSGIGAQWFMGMIRRIMKPGSTFDHVLLLVGPQGIGKTSFFRIIGGPWYKSYTGAIDNKDFYLALRGAMIVDLDEGAALYKSEAIKIKSMITETHDEYRAPYDRVMKKYPRRFVFSMSTNDTEPFRDATGNRRYWAIDTNTPVNFEWLTNNREQLFAEAFHAFKNKTKIPEVPLDKALASQDSHLPEDSWTDLIMETLQRSKEYCEGRDTYFTTTAELYKVMFPNENNILKLERRQEMRIAEILKKSGGLESRQLMVDGERKRRWVFRPDRADKLKEQNLTSTQHPLEDEF